MTIRILEEQELDTFARIAAGAYPGYRATTEEDLKKLSDKFKDQNANVPTSKYYGLFRDGALLGGMRLLDYTMNFDDLSLRVGGVGMVAVHLLHKKEKVARDMILYALDHFRQTGAYIVTLYPFRPDFYRRMGFGYGIKTTRFTVKPKSLPNGCKNHVVELGPDDKEDMLRCYNKYWHRTHGMFQRHLYDFGGIFDLPENRMVGYKRGGELEGYLVFAFRPDKDGRFMQNDIVVKEYVFLTPDATSGILSFLHTQSDQVRSITFNTQDENFHFLLTDPRNGSDNVIPIVSHEMGVQGIGLMYRIVDVKACFRALSDRDFGGQTMTLKLVVGDSFYPRNEGPVVLRFDDGRLTVMEDDAPYDVTAFVDIADLSSLLMGAVDFKSLYSYGLADVSDGDYVPKLDKAFVVGRPVCLSAF
jgi:predicted acetyltransferase